MKEIIKRHQLVKAFKKFGNGYGGNLNNRAKDFISQFKLEISSSKNLYFLLWDKSDISNDVDFVFDDCLGKYLQYGHNSKKYIIFISPEGTLFVDWLGLENAIYLQHPLIWNIVSASVGLVIGLIIKH